MKILIAIVTCHAYRRRADAQRDTWVKAVPVDVDVRFFLSDAQPAERPDEILLPVGDRYEDLPAKTRAMHVWALTNGYDFVFKCDDDTYLRPERLLTSGFETADYTGRLRGASGGYPAAYASGFGYWLSKRAMLITAIAPLTADPAEDRWVANTLLQHGITCRADYRYVVTRSHRNAICSAEASREGNDIIAACEFPSPEAMLNIHEEFLTLPATPPGQRTKTGELDRVCIMIKTFLRDGYLAACLKGIRSYLPEAKIVLVDDGREARDKIAYYAKLRAEGDACVWLPFDSGFGAKANAAIPECDREYVLIGSDDFDFAAPDAREGIVKLIDVLDSQPEIAVASGRVDSRPYEGFVHRGSDFIREIPLPMNDWLHTPKGTAFKYCDLTVNYSLIRRSILGLDKVRWHAEWKIGGDHFTFFDDVRKAGHKIAFVPGVNINQLPFVAHWQDSTYPMYRGRAKDALPSFFAAQKITCYIGFDGRVDTL